MNYPPEYPTGQQPPYQPNTQYPPQQPYYPQAYPPYGQPPQPGPYPPQPPYAPPPQPPKKNKTGLWVSVGVVVLVLFLCVAAGSHGSSSPGTTTTTDTNTTAATTQPLPTQAPTATPKPLKWTATHTFKGNGEQKTATFSVPNDWAIIWACNPSSFDGMNYNVIISVYNSDGSLADLAINSMCKPGTTTGQTEEHQGGGQVYLDVSSEGDWAIQVLEMK